MVDRNSILNHKKTHDHKVENGRYVGPDIPVNLNTGWNCLDRARKRMSYSIPGSVLGDSFTQALNTAEGTELFSVLEKGGKDLHKVILRNSKDDWNRDVKFINAPSKLGFEVGNTVIWDRLDIKWLVTWQDLGINEYFRGEMRRATHLLRWKDENGFICEQWAAIEGPVETRAKYEQTRGTAIIERRNDSVEIWIGSLDKSINSFKKFTRVIINGRAWEVQVRDDITNDSIYRMSLIEDYTNKQVDDVINAIPAGKIDFAPSEKDPIEAGIKIVGPNGIKERVATYFKLVASTGENILDATWSVEGSYKESSVLSDGRFEIIGSKIGSLVKITAEKDGYTNNITIRTVGMFSDLDKS